MLFVVKWGSCGWVCCGIWVCMCRNPVGLLGLLGFKWVKWVYCFSDLSILALCVYVRMGMRSEKCKIPLILPFLGSYLSFHL